jgi:hypothetical protein
MRRYGREHRLHNPFRGQAEPPQFSGRLHGAQALKGPKGVDESRLRERVPDGATGIPGHESGLDPNPARRTSEGPHVVKRERHGIEPAFTAAQLAVEGDSSARLSREPVYLIPGGTGWHRHYSTEQC